MADHLGKSRRSLSLLHIAVILVITCTTLCTLVRAQDDDDDSYQYSRGPLPQEFRLNMSYPARTEMEECRPIRLRIQRNSRLFRTRLVVNTNSDINFNNSDARIMTSRTQTRLNALAQLYYQRYRRRFTVMKSWAEYGDDDIDDPQSLHFEGRTVRVVVVVQHISLFLQLAVEVGFDWVYYASYHYVRLSVIPDVCDTNLDMVFMLDQSGSVGRINHNIALSFLQNVVAFFDISGNATQVGLVTYSSGAAIRFDLDDHQTLHSLQSAFASVRYTGGSTATALALFLARIVLDPTRGYGARPLSNGIPRIAVLLTDGRSNLYAITEFATNLRRSGVLVYTVGIGNIYLPELRFIASDPDPLHVFLLDSFNDAASFVDFLSFTTCDAPAVVEPGDNTTTEIEEDEFRFFQTECAAFSLTVMIEQIDVVGTCSLYASSTEQNPGPLSPHGSVVRNEDRSVRRRSVRLTLSYLARRFVYVSVRGLAYRNTFTIIIWDMLFNEDQYTVNVLEGVRDVQIFDLVDELKITNVTFNYTITNGNEDNFFEVDPQTGVLYVREALNASTHSSFWLTIVAQNSMYSCHRGRVRIQIIVIRNRIEFPNLPLVSVREDAPVGEFVTQVQASGNPGVVEYSIVGGNDGSAFQISSTSGEISVASALNFEGQSSYSLMIRAVSVTTGASGTAVQEIQVLDINEPPFFTTPCAASNSCVFTVFENEPNRTLVGTTSANDPDLSTTLNGTLEFTLVPNSVPFRITQTGELLTNAVLDREQEDSYTFDILVHDLGTPQLSVMTTITVNVGDRNDNPPVFVQSPPTIPVQENTAVGTILAQFIATDNDIGTNAEIIYTMRLTSTMGPLPLQIDPQTGEITVIGVIDFENITFYSIEVNASNPDGLSTSTSSVVTVKDVNDNPPVFSQDVYRGEVAENSAPGTPIVTVVATDEDSSTNGMIQFSIMSGNFGGMLQIDQVSGMIALLSTASGDIDRETIQFFNLTIQARDLGSPAMFDFATVIIRITDLNDNPPVFSPVTYSARIREDATFPQDILQLFATDRDEPGNPNSEILFKIASGNMNLFAVNDTTGVLSLIGQLDFETQSTFSLLVTASDQGVPQMNGTANVEIEVINVNEVPPDVSGNQTIEVSELTPVGFVIAKVNASDLDQMELNFTIVSIVTDEGGASRNADGVFAIDGNGRVTLEQELDFETIQGYAILIKVSDGQLVVYTSLVVIVLDENDSPPVFTGGNFFQVTEEEPVGIIVGTVQATDLDSGTNGEILFSIVTDTPAALLFSINTSSGELRTSEVLDRETLVTRDLFLPSDSSTAMIRVQARDMGTPSLVTTSLFRIQLLDINDNPPVFELPSYLRQIYENIPPPAVVFQVLATDSDLGTNSEVTYSFELVNATSGSPNPFTSNNTSGLLQTNVPLDREEQEEYTLVVTATDNGNPAMSATVIGTVIVLDVNDNTPEFSQNQYDVSVPENAEIGTMFLQVIAVDADAGSNAEVVYSIQNDFNQFSINSFNGSISLIAMLDYETRNRFNFTVVARDSGSPPRSSSAEVIVNVVNVDETPPTFLGPCDIEVFENVPPNTAIILCRAVDFDDVTNMSGNAITYAIIDGNFDNTFRISSTGDIITQRAVDREERPFYILNISATDPARLRATIQANITLVDINDNSPLFANLPNSVTITTASIASYSTDVFTVQATDADIGVNAELVYSITNPLNDTETQLTVVVSDRGSPSLSTTSTLTVRFETPCTIQRYTINSTTGEITGQYLCSVTVEPIEVNVTLGGTHEFLCRIVRNLDPSFQWQQNGSFITGMSSLSQSEAAGNLRIFSVMFEDAGEYACMVTTAIGSLLSMNALVMVQVAPVIIFAPQRAAVEEGRSVQFTCFGTGIPDPTYSWRRPTSLGGEIDVQPTTRVAPSGPLLVISEVQDGDQGNYTCAATNPAGVDRAFTTLTIFGLPDVVVVEVMNFSRPDASNTCHEFNATQFNDIMTSITDRTTMTTNQSGDALCNTTACSPNPCQNGAPCELDSSMVVGYVCNCTAGYTGQNCEQDINECSDDPCQFGGTCTNTNGSFSCLCGSGFTGHRCQYSTVCETQSPCPANLTCVATVTNSQGYVCQEVGVAGSVVVTNPASSPGLLDDQVNSLMETQESSNTMSRKRRQTDNMITDAVTVCEARFLQTPDTTDSYVLVWVCPVGVAEPSQDDQMQVCQLLVDGGFVTSCTPPDGSVISRPVVSGPQLPDISLRISFILLDPSGNPLSSSSALTILENTNALARLRAQGFQATGFSSAVPPTQPVIPNTGDSMIGAIAGAVVAVVVATVIVAIIIAVVCVTKKKRSKRSVHLPGNGQVHMSSLHKSENIYEAHSAESSEDLTISNPYVQMPSPATASQKENTFTFTAPQTLSEPSPDQVFDDPTYATGYKPPPPPKPKTPRHQYQPPSTQTTPKKTSTLERAANLVREKTTSLKRRTESSSNLLESTEESGDYDEVLVNPAARGGDYEKVVIPSVQLKSPHKGSRPAEQREYDEETVYGNIQHQRLGAMGNAGERWESYWKTNTLLRTDEQPQSPKK